MSSSDTLTYTSTSGDVITWDQTSVIRLGEGDSLRSRAWGRTLGYRSLTGVSRPAREVSMEVLAVGYDAADAMRRAFDYDMATGSPGTLSMGGWSQSAYVVESSADTWRPGVVALTLTVALLDGVWRCPHTTSVFKEGSSASGAGGKGYPHGYPYNYAPVTTPNSVEVTGYLPAPCRIVVYGACSDPSVTIGGNAYSYSGDVPSGGYLTIDGVSMTATLTDAYGDETNALSGVSIGTGEGCGEYAFERLQPGWSSVTWDGSFGFDLTWYEEEGEPPWTLS